MSIWTLIDSLDAPVSNVFDFPSLTLTGIEIVQIVICGVRVTTDGTDLRLTAYMGGVEVTASYRWGVQSVSSDATEVDSGDTSDPSMLMQPLTAGWDTGNATGECFNGIVHIDGPLDTAVYKKAEITSLSVSPDGRINSHCGVAILENAAAIEGFKISASSNITGGHVRILGAV